MVSRTADVAVSALIAACLLAGALAQEPDESASFEACDSDSDFCTELQLRSKFEPADMVLEFTSVSEETSNGNLRGNFVDSNPYLATLPGDGVGQNLVTLGACGVQTPHTHPRGTEFSYAVNGTFEFGFIEENGGRFILVNLTEGQTISVPQGLLHFAHNPSCEPISFLASFPTRDPGTQTTFRALFTNNVPNWVIRSTTGLSDEDIAAVSEWVGERPNPGVDTECLCRCNPDKCRGGSLTASGTP